MKQNIPKRKQLRLPNFDYSQERWYYVTICVDNMKNVFGEIKDEKFEYSKLAEVIDCNWNYLKEQFQNISLDEYVIMPNHFHGIVIIDYQDEISLGQIVRFFKARSSKMIHDSGFRSFKWQRNYFEHIIRNEVDLQNIRNYIRQNPLTWQLEKNEHVSNW